MSVPRDPLALQVAARFLVERFAAKRPMKPEKLKELMLKLRKGAGTSLKMEDVLPVFEHLGGWKFEETLILVPDNSWGGPEDNRSYSNDNPNNVKAEWEHAKANEVKLLPSPEHAKRYQKYYLDVSDIQTLPSGHPGFTYRAWRADVGTKVTSPNGKSITIRAEGRQFLGNYLVNMRGEENKVRFSDWLKGEGGFIDQINQQLGLESYEVERQKAKTPPKTRSNTGTCPCCFGNFKLVPRTKKGKDKAMPGMTLHGYKRPGTGFIEGNCYGQDWPPFELSPEGTESWVDFMEKLLRKAKDRLAELERGEVDWFIEQNGLGGKVLRKSEMHPRDWEKLYHHRQKDQEEKVKRISEEIDRLKKRISEWKPEALYEEPSQ